MERPADTYLTNILKIDPEKVTDQIVDFLKKELKDRGKGGICIGISGGIDSSTTLYLSLRAVEDPKQVYAYHLYEKSSSQETRDRATRLAEKTGINFEIWDISDVLDAKGTYKPFWVQVTSVSAGFNKIAKAVYHLFPLWLREKIGVGQVLHDTFQQKHGARREILEKISEEKNLMLVGAGNKTETFGGWFTVDGIDDVEIMPLFEVYKSQVKQLAEYLGVPKVVIDATPTHDMLMGLGDETLMNASYSVVDRVFYMVENELSLDILKDEGIDRKVYDRLKKRHEDTEWKRTASHAYPNFT